MTRVLNLIAVPGSGAMNKDLLAKVKHRLGLPLAPVRWLCEGEACDIEIPAAPVGGAADAVALARSALQGAPVDANAVPASNRRKKLLIADMDSTMIEQECIDELAELAGVGAHVRAVTERAMRGEIDFVPALRERVRLLAGLPVEVVARVIEERISLTPGGRALVSTMRAHGASAALVSGGFTAFTGHVAERLGFDMHRANVLLEAGGRLTGEVAEPVLGKDAKVEAMQALCAEHGIVEDDVIAVGDGANDIPMLRRAGLGVALHGKPAVREAAGAVVDRGDLTALLYLQGYRRDEFVD